MAVAAPTRNPAVEAWAKASPAVRARARWELLARPEQLTPAGRWNVWLFLAGRGAGKSRSAAEDMAKYGITHPETRLAIVGPTYADARDTCVEGESGMLACLPDEVVETWNRSLGELILTNGTRYKLFSGDEPDRLRGPQHHRVWCDELAHFRYRATWDMLMMGLRLGEHPQCVVSTTPRPSQLLKELVTRPDVIVTRGSTFDNAANLAPAALESLRRRYAGTELGRQELFGELLAEREGALWKRSWIDDNRSDAGPRKGYRVKVMGLDPAGAGEEGSEHAWTVAGLGLDHELYVLGSEGMIGVSMGDWLRAAIKRALVVGATIVIEKNHGGDALVELLERVMREMGVRVPYRIVWASKGKVTRAEPVALLYEQNRVHHCGGFPELEDAMCLWTGATGERGVDRLDALVWAIHELSGYRLGPPPEDGQDGAVPYTETAGVNGAVAYE